MKQAFSIIAVLASTTAALWGVANTAATEKATAPAAVKKTIVKPVKKIPAQVLLSSCNPDKNDASAALLKALQTGTRKIVFDRPGTYHLRPVKLRSNLEIVFAADVTVKALAQLPAPKGKVTPLPALFSGRKIRNVTFAGSSGTRIYGVPGGTIFDFQDSSNISLKNLDLAAGKCGARFTGSSGIRINDSIFDDFQGNAIDFNGGSWFTIFNLVLRNIGGSAVSITSDRFGRTQNGSIDNIEVYNSSCGITFLQPDKIRPFTGKLPPKYRPPVFVVRNSRFFRNSKWDINIPGVLVSGKIAVNHCRFSNLNAPSLKLDNFSATPGNVKLEIANCIFVPEYKSTVPPLKISSTADLPMGNVNVKNSTVKLPVNRRAIQFDLKNNTGSLSGTLQLTSPDGQVKNVNLNATQE